MGPSDAWICSSTTPAITPAQDQHSRQQQLPQQRHTLTPVARRSLSPRTIDVTGSTSTGNFGITSPRRTVDATIPVSAAAPQQSERGGDASLRNMWARQLRVVQTGSDASSQVGASAAGGNVATAQAGGSVRRLSSQSPQQLLHVSRVFPSWNRSILTEI
jgi:pyruvate/2-oxoglutarate dehydrogenase complex dihydrolipoamide acyltransferase (E2) component